MAKRTPGLIVACAALPVSMPAAARQESAGLDPVSIGTGVGMAVVVLLAVLIGLSVVAKLLIVFGAVPREGKNGFHALVHGAANFVGGLARPRPRRSASGRLDQR